MQIYWGAVPFVLIQIVMVGLIIAFPEIVSSGLDKEEKIDLDKVQIEMMAEPAVDAEGAAADPTANKDGEAPQADNDPMKAMQEAMDKDSGKK